jgi:hypothetical protein
LAAELALLREVRVEHIFVRIADCSLARRRRRDFEPQQPSSQPAGPGVVVAAEDDEDEDGEDDDEEEQQEEEAKEEEEEEEEEEECAAPQSWRLARIRDTCAATSPKQLELAERLWRAHAQQQQPPPPHPPTAIRWRVVARRGGKGHDFSSDDVKRAAAMGLLSGSAARAAGAGGLGEPALRGYELSLRAQVHRKSFVMMPE